MKTIFILTLVFLFACNAKKKQTVLPPDSNLANDELRLSDQQIQLGNIQVDTLKNGLLGDQVVLPATLNFDQSGINTVSSRVMGRIEKLYFRNEGDYVRKGDRLFDLYSEDLNTARQEYVMALERQKNLDNSVIDFGQLVRSSKNKLLLWGMNEAQINELSHSGKYNTVTTFYSTESGYITTLDAREGDYVMEGGTVVHLADLSTLWVEAQVYTSQLTGVDLSGIALVRVPEMPGTEIRGKIEFVNPETSPDSRINLVRVTIPNNSNRLKPGMQAYVIIKSKESKMLTLPIDAVIRDGNGATVWIKTGPNIFRNKMVYTGKEAGDRIEITGGLKAGDVVVISGAYLVNSEFIFKKGSNPMAGHDMDKM